MRIEMRSGGFRDQTGATLVEMLVVVVVIAVVFAAALVQFQAPRAQFSRQNVSRGLKVALERARFDSVKRRADVQTAQARVVISSTSYKLGLDKDKDGTVETSEMVTTSFSGQNISITGSGMTLPVTVYYNQRGEVMAVDGVGTAVTPIFRVCLGDCSTPTNANSDLIIVTPTGTVNLLSGSSSAPSFAAPTVTSVSSDTDVEPLATLP